jgi:hypothetical protein
MAGRAMPQAQKLAQVRRLHLPEHRHFRAILAASQQSAELKAPLILVLQGANELQMN